MGISSSVQALAQSIPAILSGFVAAYLVSSTPLFLAGAIIIVSGITFGFMYKN